MKKRYLLFTLFLMLFAFTVKAELNSGFAKINEFTEEIFGPNVSDKVYRYNDYYIYTNTTLVGNTLVKRIIAADLDGGEVWISNPNLEIQDFVLDGDYIYATTFDKLVKLSASTGEVIKTSTATIYDAAIYSFDSNLVLASEEELSLFDTNLNFLNESDIDESYFANLPYYFEDVVIEGDTLYLFAVNEEDVSIPGFEQQMYQYNYFLCELNSALETEKCSMLEYDEEFEDEEVYLGTQRTNNDVIVLNDKIYIASGSILEISNNKVSLLKDEEELCYYTDRSPTPDSDEIIDCNYYVSIIKSKDFIIAGGYNTASMNGFVEIYDTNFNLIDTISYDDYNMTVTLNPVEKGFLVSNFDLLNSTGLEINLSQEDSNPHYTPNPGGNNKTINGYADLTFPIYHTIIEEYQLQYKIETTTTKGKGNIKVSKNFAFGNEVIQVTIEPEEGYTLSAVKVTDADGNVLEFHDYTFTMPSADVTIEAEFVLAATNPETMGLAISFILIMAIFAGIVTILGRKKMKEV